eukprot:jgi/Galph1/2485/GphlegSOOS_G1149.1
MSFSKLAVVQLRSTKDTKANFENCQKLIHEAVLQGASFVSLPECFEFIGGSTKDALQIAQPLDGPLFSRYRQLAVKENIWLSLAGFHEKGPDDAHIYNTQAIINPKGSMVAVYRKLHLFDVDIRDGRISESSSTAYGKEMILVTNTPIGNVGLTTCYDIRFPELYSCLAGYGAHIILVPSAFFPSTGEAHWEVLLRSRAIENEATKVYIAAAAQVGKHNEKRSSYGHSMIVDPWGNVVSQLIEEENEVILGTIDRKYMEEVRRRVPKWNHRRSDVYAIIKIFAQASKVNRNTFEQRIADVFLGKHNLFPVVYHRSENGTYLPTETEKGNIEKEVWGFTEENNSIGGTIEQTLSGEAQRFLLTKLEFQLNASVQLFCAELKFTKKGKQQLSDWHKRVDFYFQPASDDFLISRGWWNDSLYEGHFVMAVTNDGNWFIRIKDMQRNHAIIWYAIKKQSQEDEERRRVNKLIPPMIIIVAIVLTRMFRIYLIPKTKIEKKKN